MSLAGSRPRADPRWAVDIRLLVGEACAVAAIAIMVCAALGALVPAVMVVCLGGLLVAGAPRAALWRPLLPLLAVPLLALASAAWSPSPSLTLRYAIQLFATFLLGVAIVVALPPRLILRAVFLGFSLACLASIADGGQGTSTKGPVLIGLTGSKDMMAACGNVIAVTAVAILADRRQAGWARLGALPMLALAIYIVATTRAATFIVALGAAVPIALVLMFFAWLPRRGKLALLGAVALVAAPVALVAPTLSTAAQDYFFTTFEKDRTLTGRTYLWEVARQKIEERPMLGWGYKYVWMSYSPAAVGMLRSQKLADARTFSMHQTYLEMWTDLGPLGLIFTISLVAGGAILSVVVAALRGTAVDIAGATLLVTALARSFGETILAPFFVHGVLVIVFGGSAILAARRLLARSRDPRPAGRAAPRRIARRPRRA